MEYLKPQKHFSRHLAKNIHERSIRTIKNISFKHSDFLKVLKYDKRGNASERRRHCRLSGGIVICSVTIAAALDHFRQKPTSSGRARRSHRTNKSLGAVFFLRRLN